MSEQRMKTEELTPKHVRALAQMAGIGTAFLNLNNIDYAVGRGILKGNDRCLWTKDGHRITVTLGRDGFSCIGIDKNPDPEHAALLEALKKG